MASLISITAMRFGLKGHKYIRMRVCRVRIMRLALGFLPFVCGVFWKARISLKIRINVCQIHTLGAAEKHGENLPSSDHHDFRGIARRLQSRICSMHDDASRRSICLIACDDDIDAVGQGSADGFKCLSAHNDRLAARKVAEVLEVCGHAPWQGVVFADDTVSVHRRDKRDDHSRGATDTLRNSATFSLNSSTEPLF